MNNREKLLSGTLLILIGVMAGMILMILRQGSLSFNQVEVQVTEVSRSEYPVWTSDELEVLDDRFLFREVANKTTPSVVYIETIVSNRNMESSNERDDAENLWERFLPPRSRSVGSGVLISEDGYIITNDHVIANSIRDGITVTLDDKRTYDARIIGRDPSTDLAVIKIDASNLIPATIGNSDRVEVGEWVLAIGNPFRLRSTVTAGIVGALSREVHIINDQYRIESFIQTDAAINRGNSGGALVNTSGQLIGINTAIATQSGSYQGYGFAVPSNLALKVARDLIEFGEVKRGLMGVNIQTVDSRSASRVGLDSIRGVLISGIGGDETAASKAGLLLDDVIIGVNGEPVNESSRLQEKVAMFRPDDTIELEIWRAGEVFTVNLTLQQLEATPPVAAIMDEFDDEPELEQWQEIPEGRSGHGEIYRKFEDVGFTLSTVTGPGPGSPHIFIQRVFPGSEAHHRGVQIGSELLEINGVSAESIEMVEDEILYSLQNHHPITLKVKTINNSIGYFKLF